MELTSGLSNYSNQNCPLSEYPRPAMKRDSYINLNGTWDYAFTKDSEFPDSYDGTILVPFSPETSLSGVNRQLQPDEFLWYHRFFTNPSAFGSRVLLHFGAVDQKADVYINQTLVSTHCGGYLPFYADITDALLPGQNSLLVRVQDVSDTSYHARGKQKLTRGGMFYTAQSGIWQTVFLECVPCVYIKDIQTKIDYDKGEAAFYLDICDCNAKPSANAPSGSISIYDNDKLVAVCPFDENHLAVAVLPEFHPWSPETPFLYTATVTFGLDRIETYFAMRKISIAKDSDGVLRMMLNNKPYFQNGLLDQGYWPESLYTPPSDEAMIKDIKTAKELGFNLLRKHAKIEPDRWYYHCDRLGMLVWQDMVNGGSTYDSWFVTYFPTICPWLARRTKDSSYHKFSRDSQEGREEFTNEVKAAYDALKSHPCIVMWVLFNEGWGQFDTCRLTTLLKSLDSDRLIDSSSGWFDQKCGDVRSLHIYFTPMHFTAGDRALILSEFGGYTLPVTNHMYSDKIYGYRHYKDKEELTDAIVKTYRNKIIPGIKKGLCASIYTQVSDIEDEINGLMTYDRMILKVNPDKIKAMNEKVNAINQEVNAIN